MAKTVPELVHNTIEHPMHGVYTTTVERRVWFRRYPAGWSVVFADPPENTVSRSGSGVIQRAGCFLRFYDGSYEGFLHVWRFRIVRPLRNSPSSLGHKRQESATIQVGRNISGRQSTLDIRYTAPSKFSRRRLTCGRKRPESYTTVYHPRSVPVDPKATGALEYGTSFWLGNTGANLFPCYQRIPRP
jgi:hypothetical protein